MECEFDVLDDEPVRTVYLNKNDLCIDCEQQYGCPLIECLSNGLVGYRGPIDVKDCAHYKKFDNL